MPAREDRPWLDELYEKHECDSSPSPYRRIEARHEEGTVGVSIPDNLDEPEDLEFRKVIRSGDLLVLLGFYPDKDDSDGGFGVLMIARQPSGGGDDVVHVWHALYPWAISHLGLGEVEVPDP